MNFNTDWNCKLHTQQDVKDIANTLLWMREHHSISRVCFMVDFDATCASYSAFLIQKARFINELSLHLPSSFKINYTAAVHLTPHVSKIAELDRLTATANSLLPLSLPLGSYADWIDTELNHLLYRRRISPLFLSFELYPILYPQDALERLLRIPNAAYEFNYKAFSNPACVRMISSLLQRGAPVLLGTHCTLVEKLTLYDLDHFKELAKETLDPTEYLLLTKHNKQLWK